MEKYKVIFYVSVLVCIASVMVFIVGYSALPETVPIHRNYSGQIDSWGHKLNLFILPAISCFAILVISYLIKRPHILNYPVEVTEKNKAALFKKAQLFLAVVSLFVSAQCLVFILDDVNFISLPFDATFFVIYVVVFSLLPFFAIYWFSRKSADENK